MRPSSDHVRRRSGGGWLSVSDVTGAYLLGEASEHGCTSPRGRPAQQGSSRPSLRSGKGTHVRVSE